MTERTARLFEQTEPYRIVRTQRPTNVVTPGPGQESVWDYPRPPRVEGVDDQVRVLCGDEVIAETVSAKRIVETAGAPVYYIPPDDLAAERLLAGSGPESICEWKGPARYWNVRAEGRFLENVGWSYPDPFPGFEGIRDYVAFYPAHLDCFVGEVRAKPQPGGFYGGWVTRDIVGPIKGEPGTEGW